MKLTRFLARWKLRWDYGCGFINIFILIFSAIGASDKIATLIHLPAKAIIPIIMIIAPMVVLLAGYWMDRKGFITAFTEEQNNRNNMLKEIHTKNKK